MERHALQSIDCVCWLLLNFWWQIGHAHKGRVCQKKTPKLKWKWKIISKACSVIGFNIYELNINLNSSPTLDSLFQIPFYFFFRIAELREVFKDENHYITWSKICNIIDHFRFRRGSYWLVLKFVWLIMFEDWIQY